MKNKGFIRIVCICLAAILGLSAVFASIYTVKTFANAELRACDPNRDAIVNTKDIIRTLKYIKNPAEYPYSADADANRDGVIDYNDTNMMEANLGQVYNKPDFSNISTVIPFMPHYKTADTYFVVVQGSGTSCTLHAFTIENGKVHPQFVCTGYIGRNGVCNPEDKYEGDGKTPAGVYSMGECFGVSSAPCTVPRGYTVVTSDDYWDSNSTSSTYNQHVKGWQKNSAWHASGQYEKLINYKTSYAYAAMINYNVNPAVPYKGSAIFLHCTVPSDTSSSGCIAIPNSYMKKALALMEDEVYIAIVPNAQALEKYFA